MSGLLADTWVLVERMNPFPKALDIFLESSAGPGSIAQKSSKLINRIFKN